MNVSKLVQAANFLKNNNPELSQEIYKTAQDLSNQQIDLNQSLNPNIKNFANPVNNVNNKEVHKITLQIEVPENTNETDILNNIMPNAEMLHSKGYKLKGYSFGETTRTQG